MSKNPYYLTEEGLLVGFGETSNGEIPSEAVFGLALEDGKPKTYHSEEHPNKPAKYLLNNREYDLYSYITKEQLLGLDFVDAKWTVLTQLVEPELDEIKSAKKSKIKL